VSSIYLAKGLNPNSVRVSKISVCVFVHLAHTHSDNKLNTKQAAASERAEQESLRRRRRPPVARCATNQTPNLPLGSGVRVCHYRPAALAFLQRQIIYTLLSLIFKLIHVYKIVERFYFGIYTSLEEPVCADTCE
jgi:hypothetical protein